MTAPPRADAGLAAFNFFGDADDPCPLPLALIPVPTQTATEQRMAADTRTTAGPSLRHATRARSTAIGPSTFGWPRQGVARWALLLPVMMALLLAGDAAPGRAPALTALPAAQP